MLGASPYLEEQFEELNRSDSRKVLALWIESYRQIPKAWNKETMGENKWTIKNEIRENKKL